MNVDLQRIFRAMPFSGLILFADERFTIAEASDAYLDATLTTREAIVGRGIFDVFPDNPAEAESCGTARVRASLEAVLATGALDAMRIQRYDVPSVTGGFARKYWQTTNHPILGDDGKVAYIVHRVQDVTQISEATLGSSEPIAALPGQARLEDRMPAYVADVQQVGEVLMEDQRRWLAAEQKAEQAGEKLALAVEAADLGTFYCPMPLGKIIWNSTCKHHFFLDDEAEVDFALFYQLIHPEDRERTRIAIADAVFGNALYDVEYRAVAADGRQRWIRAKGRAYKDANGQPTRFDGITIDISRQKEVEQQRRESDRQKDEFLAMLGHELRNPLAPIRAAAQLMMQGPMDAARLQTSCMIIERQAQHMTALIDDLLDVSRVTRGLVQLQKEPLLLQEVIADALEQTRPLVTAHGHVLEAGQAGSLQVCGDKKRLVQVFANLLHNAAKYTPEGGRIMLDVAVEADTAVVRVRDNGVGISDALKPHVFDLFTQAARTPDRRQGGLGIGLALVRSMLLLHDGSVSVRSDGPGLGTEFEVRLPLHAAAMAPAGATAAQAEHKKLPPLSVLVVDDNQDAALMLAYAVENAGHTVHVEHDAHDALHKVTGAHRTLVDVCLLDIGLPDIDGNEVARRLRANPRTSGVALIAVTGYGQPDDIDTALQAGFDRCLVKPVDISQLGLLLCEISHSKADGVSLRRNIAMPF